METYDVIVIGVGGMGSATVYHLARRGARVLGVEQFDIPHELGSSHGNSRIIRLAYAEDPRYVPFLRRAYELWRELEADVGERLLITTSGIDAGFEDSATVEGALRSCAIHDLPHEILDAAALGRRFPGYRLDSRMVGVVQPEAGFLLPERCIIAHVRAARALGADVHASERAMGWDVDESGVVVSTNRRSYRANRLVITAGPWARALVPALQDVAVPERQVMLWTQPLRPELFGPESFPVVNLESPEGRFYGLPVYGIPGFKFGKYNHRRERVDDPDHMDRGCHPEDEEVLRVGLRRYFPDADGPTVGMKTCLFTNSPDGYFILDLLSTRPPVGIAAGFSGHGFKFCSVIGEIMAELVMDGSTRPDFEMFSLDRFSIKSDSRVGG